MVAQQAHKIKDATLSQAYAVRPSGNFVVTLEATLEVERIEKHLRQARLTSGRS